MGNYRILVYLTVANAQCAENSIDKVSNMTEALPETILLSLCITTTAMQVDKASIK